jgi:hypothetical protein
VVFCHPTVEQLDHYQAVVQGLQAELGTEDASFSDDSDEGLGDTVSLASVLPVLIQLRKACNVREIFNKTARMGACAKLLLVSNCAVCENR